MQDLEIDEESLVEHLERPMTYFEQDVIDSSWGARHISSLDCGYTSARVITSPDQSLSKHDHGMAESGGVTMVVKTESG